MDGTLVDSTSLPGAKELLRSLPRTAVALVTSADRSLAEIRMAAAGLPLPATAVTADLITRGKPDPEGYLRAAELLGVEPADALVFEDAPAGIAAGLAAGIRTVAVGPNTGPLPDGVLHIRDYACVRATVGSDAAGVRTITFRFEDRARKHSPTRLNPRPADTKDAMTAQGDAHPGPA
jgi:sugar-phosphatase